MQSQYNALGDLNQRLSSMRGIEFIVHSEHPPDMWIIRKQRRNSPEEGNLNVIEKADNSHPSSILFRSQ
jgi:MED6 mediator sub complex component